MAALHKFTKKRRSERAKQPGPVPQLWLLLPALHKKATRERQKSEHHGPLQGVPEPRAADHWRSELSEFGAQEVAGW